MRCWSVLVSDCESCTDTRVDWKCWLARVACFRKFVRHLHYICTVLVFFSVLRICLYPKTIIPFRLSGIQMQFTDIAVKAYIAFQWKNAKSYTKDMLLECLLWSDIEHSGQGTILQLMKTCSLDEHMLFTTIYLLDLQTICSHNAKFIFRHMC